MTTLPTSVGQAQKSGFALPNPGTPTFWSFTLCPDYVQEYIESMWRVTCYVHNFASITESNILLRAHLASIRWDSFVIIHGTSISPLQSFIWFEQYMTWLQGGLHCIGILFLYSTARAAYWTSTWTTSHCPYDLLHVYVITTASDFSTIHVCRPILFEDSLILQAGSRTLCTLNHCRCSKSDVSLSM